jgi:hypothetical protein
VELSNEVARFTVADGVRDLANPPGRVAKQVRSFLDSDDSQETMICDASPALKDPPQVVR